jgi:hypothetical protein
MSSIDQHSFEVTRNLNALIQHGHFFRVKLYPPETIERLQKVLRQIPSFKLLFMRLVAEWKHYLPEHLDTPLSSRLLDKDVFEWILGNTSGIENSPHRDFKSAYACTRQIQERNVDQIEEAKRLRKNLVHDLTTIENELEDFLQAN